MAPASDASKSEKDVELVTNGAAKAEPVKSVPAPASDDGEEKVEGERKGDDWNYSHGLTTEEAEKLLQEWGRNCLPEKSTPKWLVYLKCLWGPMPIMIWIAIIIEFAITNFIDAGILLGIQFFNATLGWYETVKAADAVAALKASLKPKAVCKRDGKWQEMNAELVVPGDLVLLAAGAAIPADCVVNEGRLEVDQSALTGESLPVTFYKGDSAKMGSTAVRGEVEATVEFTGAHTFFGKTAALLGGDTGLGSLQRLLLRIMFVLVAMSLTLCITALIYLLARGEPGREAVAFAVVLLVASIPLAIEIVTTTTLALGSRQLSVHGAIVSRLAAIEEMAGMNLLCSDKTGTLTLNKMAIQDHAPTYLPDLDRAGVLRYAALAAKWKEPAKDALDTMVLGAADLDSLEVYTMLEHEPFDPVVKRTESTIKGPDGDVFKVTKGAPQIIAKLIPDDPLIAEAMTAEVQLLGARGIRSLAVARTVPGNTEKWQAVGMLSFLDPPRPDTKQTIEEALALGVDVKMVTGDQKLIAIEMSRQLGLGLNIPDAAGLPSMGEDGKVPDDLVEKYGAMILEADGFAQVYPEHKYLIVEVLRKMGFAVGMTGDGVNDAPALKRADVGIAVSGATDAARAAADIVLTQPGLSVLIHAIELARCVFKRVNNFISYRVAATLQLLVFFFIAVFAFDPKNYNPTWTQTFFQLPVLLLMLITLLNDGTLISVGYDHVTPSPRPDKWNLKVLFLTSSILGMVSCGSSLLLLALALDCYTPDYDYQYDANGEPLTPADCPNTGSLFYKWGLPAPHYGQLVMMIYLKVSLSDFLTLFASRSSPGFFFSHRPGYLLLGASTIALGISTLLSCIWPTGDLDGVPVMGLAKGDYTLWPLWIWCFCLFWFFVQDGLKVLAYWLILKYDVFKYRTGAMVNVREVHAPDANTAADMETGAVEKKLLGRKVEKAMSQVERIAKTTPGAPAALARVSQNLNLARVSAAALQRLSARPGGPDVELGAPEIEAVVADLEAAAREVPATPEDRAELARRVEEVKRVAQSLERVSAVRLGRTSVGAPNLARTSLGVVDRHGLDRTSTQGKK